jgi:glutathione synthase/RimK-type ligase-like ATP-grasp enzyme
LIVVWGSTSDPPVERLLAILARRDLPTLQLDAPALARLRYDVTLDATPRGWLESDASRLDLDDITGIYVRPDEVAPGAARTAAAVVLAVASATRATVVNRPSAGISNGSKPFQLQLIAAAGLSVPETLVTTDPAAARNFLAQHGRVVYKSVSGVRSIVAALEAGDRDRLDGVSSGPVQLQRWIGGRDVRVHVVGERCFATAVDSAADDYRYGARKGVDPTLTAVDVPPSLQERLVALTRRLGLLVAGIDLRVTAAEQWFCFEVNPSPGFTFYEDATGQPIGDAIADLLQ